MFPNLWRRSVQVVFCVHRSTREKRLWEKIILCELQIRKIGNSRGPGLRGLSCPLCDLDLEKEKKYYEDRSFIVLRTKTEKEHRERIMIIFKRHEHTVPQRAYEHALDILTNIGKEVFSYTPKFVIMDTTFATINDHWHLVATDLNPKSEDFNQILATR